MANSSSDEEYKSGIAWKENVDGISPHNSVSRDIEGYDDLEERKIVRKIDWRLLPILGALYSISLVSGCRGNAPCVY